MEEEYEEEAAYGGDIPGEVELLGHHDDEYEEEEVGLGDEEEGEEAATDADNTQAGGPVNTAPKELEEMKKRNAAALRDMQAKAEEINAAQAALRDMQAKAEKEMSTVQDSASTAGTELNREETDARSIFVGNVDYSCTPEEVQEHFQSCGTVNRVTILIDKFGQPKGYAYVEFLEVEAVPNALLLSETELHNRPLKVSAKRTNLPGMKASRGGRFSPYYGYRPRRPYQPPFGKAPRGRRPMRYRPYY